MGNNNKCSCLILQKLDTEFSSLTVEITPGNMNMNINYSAYSCDSSFDTDVEINFCPICGRAFKKEIEQKP